MIPASKILLDAGIKCRYINFIDGTQSGATYMITSHDVIRAESVSEIEAMAIVAGSVFELTVASLDELAVEAAKTRNVYLLRIAAEMIARCNRLELIAKYG
jgi:hypothetical protein